MKLLLLSNIFNHYQAALSDAFYTLLKGDFAFLETMDMDPSRKALGWTTLERPYLLRKKQMSEEELRRLILQCDVLIFGAVPFSMVRERLHTEKLTFFYTERVFKKGDNPAVVWPRMLKYRHAIPRGSNCCLLANGAYCAADFARIGRFAGRAFRWGYFPQLKEHADPAGLLLKKTPGSIVWAGRFISWKHPEKALETALMLKRRECRFSLTMIGEGELRSDMEKLSAELGLEGLVCFTGPLSPDQVRERMEASVIFFHTADRNEGWGVVLMEAMNAMCACVAEGMVGAAPWLIRNEKEGRLFHGSPGEAADILEALLTQPALCSEMGERAYETLLARWSPELAAERFLIVAEALKNHTALPAYAEGPMGSC